MREAKIYLAVADCIRQNYKVSSDPVCFVLKDMTDQLCQRFEKFDKTFPRKTFVRYCGFEQEKKETINHEKIRDIPKRSEGEKSR